MLSLCSCRTQPTLYELSQQAIHKFAMCHFDGEIWLRLQQWKERKIHQKKLKNERKENIYRSKWGYLYLYNKNMHKSSNTLILLCSRRFLHCAALYRYSKKLLSAFSLVMTQNSTSLLLNIAKTWKIKNLGKKRKKRKHNDIKATGQLLGWNAASKRQIIDELQWMHNFTLKPFLTSGASPLPMWSQGHLCQSGRKQLSSRTYHCHPSWDPG